jgi:hypothetical protein
MQAESHRPSSACNYDFDNPTDLLLGIEFAFALGVEHKREGRPSLTGDQIAEAFWKRCKSLHARRVHHEHLKSAFRAGWQCVEVADEARDAERDKDAAKAPTK